MNEVKIKVKDGILTASIACEIDHHTAKILRERIDEALVKQKPKELVLDFSSVGFMDSSGLGLITGRVELAERVGASVCIAGLSSPLEKLLRLSGIERIENLRICDKKQKITG